MLMTYFRTNRLSLSDEVGRGDSDKYTFPNQLDDVFCNLVNELSSKTSAIAHLLKSPNHFSFLNLEKIEDFNSIFSTNNKYTNY